MIASDQPTIFGSAVTAALSSRDDGTMKFGVGDSDVVANRRKFLGEAGIDINHTTLVAITYDTDDFAKYRIVTEDDKAGGMLESGINHADALVTDHPDHALFLPIADCVGTILYDPDHRVLMVSHLGRQSVEIEGARRSVEYLRENFKTDPAHLLVWLSPGVGKATYPLHKFDGRSLHEVIIEQLTAAKVVSKNIENASINTATAKHYYSHSEYLKGNEEPGRFAIVALMHAQGEPAA